MAKRSKKGSDPVRDQVARAQHLWPAFEPLIDVCLSLGLTSPELESLVRSVFVHRTADVLQVKATRRRRAVSDVSVALATGLHRNEVHRIRQDTPRVQAARVGRKSRATRLLLLWSEDWRFLDEQGLPRTLPLQHIAQEPSFAELVARCMPGAAIGSALAELRRSGTVELLPDEQVRFVGLTGRVRGLTARNLSATSQNLAAVGQSLFAQLSSEEDAGLWEQTGALAVRKDRLPFVRMILQRRVQAFLRSLEKELSIESAPGSGNPSVRVVVFTPPT